jgi:hypothetical protein
MSFYLVFDVVGDGANQLANIHSLFVEVGQSGRDAGQAIESAHGGVIALIHGLRQLQDVGHMIREFGEGAIATFTELTNSVFENSAMFESLRAKIDFAFGSDANKAWEDMLGFSRESVFELSEIVDVVGSLRTAIQGIDPTNRMIQWRNRVGETSDAMQVMADTAAGTGRRFSMVGYEVQQMMGNVFRGAHMVLRLTHEETEAIKAVTGSAVDAQTKFSKIMEILALHYGGAN